MFPALCTTLMYENALISPNILKNTFIWGLSLHRGTGTTDSLKNVEQKFIFEILTLNPHGINKCFSFNSFISVFLGDQVHSNSVAPSSVYEPYTTYTSSIPSEKGLTLETSAFRSLYGGQFT